jgi:hypothetical protein
MQVYLERSQGQEEAEKDTLGDAYSRKCHAGYVQCNYINIS